MLGMRSFARSSRSSRSTKAFHAPPPTPACADVVRETELPRLLELRVRSQTLCRHACSFRFRGSHREDLGFPGSVASRKESTVSRGAEGLVSPPNLQGVSAGRKTGLAQRIPTSCASFTRPECPSAALVLGAHLVVAEAASGERRHRAHSRQDQEAPRAPPPAPAAPRGW